MDPQLTGIFSRRPTETPHSLPAGPRATAASGREAGGEGEPGPRGGEFAEQAVPSGGGPNGEQGRSGAFRGGAARGWGIFS